MALRERFRHPLGEFDRLEDLSAERAERLLTHVRGCADCGRRFEARLEAERLLEGKRPSTLEKRLLGEGHLGAALRAARSEPAAQPRGVWRPWLAGVAALGCAGLALVFGVRSMGGDDGFQVRGPPSRDLALRAFCVEGEGGVRELTGARARCARGAHLSFAAGAKGAARYVALGVEGQPPEAFPVTGAPGSEAPLPWTLEVIEATPRVVRVRAAFASSPEAALRALGEPRAEQEVQWDIELGGTP